MQVLNTSTNALFHEEDAPPILQDSIVATRVWQITDYCGSSFTCTQKVAVVSFALPFFMGPDDRVVYAGDQWDFEEPRVFSFCKFTNAVPYVLRTETNAACWNSYSVRRTWAAVDKCGFSNTCSQVITVIDTNRPPLICPPHRVVEYGQELPFEPPIARDLAGGTNLSIRVLGTDHKPDLRQDVRGHADLVDHGRLRQLQCLFPGRERGGHHAARDHLRLQPGG